MVEISKLWVDLTDIVDSFSFELVGNYQDFRL